MTENYQAADIAINKKREFPWIWLLPLCALLITAWLIYKAISEKGDVINIDFPTAEGLEIDKTKIRYLDVEIGKVTNISINDDSKTIRVTAQMNKDTGQYLTKNTQFWVVRPQVGLGGVSGLNTILSGAYIAIKPEQGKYTRNFIGLIQPPILKTDLEGKKFILETTNVNSMRAGTPINFHGITVGEVLNYELANNADGIKLTVFINTPYDKFIRKDTRFWIDSGIDLSANADGFKVRTGPLVSLLSGGITFRTSPEDKTTVEENTVFRLFENYEKSTEIAYHNTVKVVMFFNGSVRGLTIGAPVSLRGIPIGKVTDFNLEIDEKSAEVRIPVIAEIDSDRIKIFHKEKTISPKDNIKHLIDEGLRAQLQTGSLITGQLFISLDMLPKTKIVAHTNNTGYLEFPTVPNSLEQITHSAQAIMDKVSKLPLEEMTVEVTKTLQALQTTSKETNKTLVAIKDTLGTADNTLKSADKTMQSSQALLNSFAPGSTTQYELHQLLQQLTQTANSTRQLTDYLQQHPESVLRGKDKE